ncbi:tetraspanin family protein [Stylonychia lemnae]|uniref:Tetraspanin family protein n=1 Tax=Stylonychia lemnae TaxID=5949 RepID=A0A078AW08_STYLE|nr:tetraspanin family protein [Stylonychia lemnae]|eukprot:CDW85397.1 tetraspanin family protein [Stylonychia lemnae]
MKLIIYFIFLTRQQCVIVARTNVSNLHQEYQQVYQWYQSSYFSSTELFLRIFSASQSMQIELTSIRDDNKAVGDGAFGFVIALAIFAFIVGALGVISCLCYKKKCCLCLYSGCATVGVLIFLALGIVFIILGAASQKLVDDFCDGKKDDYKGLNSIYDSIVEIDNKMTTYTAKYYCTSDCPCPLGTYFTDKYNETLMNQYNRTFTSKPIYQPLLQSSAANVKYTFWDCYTSIKDLSKYSNVEKISDGLESLFRTLESDFSCNGICKAGPFMYFRNITSGPPGKNCLTGIKDTFKEKPLAIGIILLVSFALTFVALFATYGLCCRRNKDEDNFKHGKHSHH